MSKIYIDVREPWEYGESHFDGAINIPLGEIEDSVMLNTLSFDDEIVVYCRSGGRASSAKQILEELGYKNVTNGINQASIGG